MFILFHVAITHFRVFAAPVVVAFHGYVVSIEQTATVVVLCVGLFAASEPRHRLSITLLFLSVSLSSQSAVVLLLVFCGFSSFFVVAMWICHNTCAYFAALACYFVCRLCRRITHSFFVAMRS